MTKRFGFTLAEVLITLGIIGVVAAMTIPTLISNTNGAQFKTAYKKALSTLNQAVLMNLAMDDTDFSNLKPDAVTGQTVPDGSMSNILTDRMQSATDITTNYFGTGETARKVSVVAPATLICCAQNINDEDSPCFGKSIGAEVDINSIDFTSSDSKVFSFADGTAFGFRILAEKCTAKGASNCYGFIDVNGANNPNEVIDCDNADEGVCESSEITDIFPVIFHGQTVEPMTESARAVLFSK